MYLYKADILRMTVLAQKIFLSSVLSLPHISANAMRPATVKSREFDNYVEKLMKEWKVPGLALAVVDGEQTVVKVRRFRVQDVP